MTDVRFRQATIEDIQAVVDMLADDALGATRETPDDLTPYRDAFAAIDADPHQLLIVCEGGGQAGGTMQITFIPGLSRKGSTRALIEGVRVHRDARGTGLGTKMMQWAVEEARARGCAMVQLTTDASRTDAHRFYERLGFQKTHLGFKMVL
ncbi:MAG TPA: GNAT family N-acetyltransferase [Thermomicrobiales bacterium]|nr:GNAT family N-acetyltransferase [Thermomicrobiales bacterium]